MEESQQSPVTTTQQPRTPPSGASFMQYRSPPPPAHITTPSSKRTSSGQIKFVVPSSPDPAGQYTNGSMQHAPTDNDTGRNSITNVRVNIVLHI